jgi:hypothetical protein
MHSNFDVAFSGTAPRPARQFMASTHDLARQTKRPARGPHLVFAGSVLLVFATLVVAGRVLAPDFVTPLVVAVLFGLAAFVAIVAWKNPGRFAPAQLSYWDVAGALILIGIGLSALVEPEQMVRLVEADGRRP